MPEIPSKAKQPHVFSIGPRRLWANAFFSVSWRSNAREDDACGHNAFQMDISYPLIEAAAKMSFVHDGKVLELPPRQCGAVGDLILYPG